MYWIIFRSKDSVPDDLYYEGCNDDKSNAGKTAYQLWKDYRYDS